MPEEIIMYILISTRRCCFAFYLSEIDSLEFEDHLPVNLIAAD